MPPLPPSWRRWAALLLVGALGGVLSGLFGVGGGILMVPLLIALVGMDQRRAAATSLVAIVPTSVAGAIGYLARGEADLRIGALVAVGGIVGSWVGAWLLRTLPMPVLRWMFVALLVVVAARMFTDEASGGRAVQWSPGIVAALVVVGLAMGVSAGLFGIGGGLVVVPALVLLLGIDHLLAKGTSLVVMVPTSITGTISLARAGVMDLRDGAVVGAAATASSFVGVAFAFLLPDRLGSILFGALVVVAATQLAWRAARAGRQGPSRSA